jgi:CRISPR-associated protein (Cas_Cas02710)
LRASFPGEFIEGNRLQVGCAKAFASLKYSPIEDDHRFPEVYERLKPALEKRNQSWLAHGTRPADPSDFDQMWDLVLRELGINNESIPDWPELSFTK